MTTDIRFETEFEKPLTFEQVESSLNFHKVFEINGKVFRKEEYKNNLLIKVIHYRDTSEDDLLILSDLVTCYPDLTWFEMRTTEQIGTYKKEIRRFLLSTGVYEDFQITLLLNEDGLLICEREDEIVNDVAQALTRKYYYDPVSKREEFEFIYGANGHLSSMRGAGSPFVAENDYSIRDSEIEFFFPGFLSEHPYYQNADLLPLD